MACRTFDECTEAYKNQDALVQGKIMDLELENMPPAQRALDPELRQLNEVSLETHAIGLDSVSDAPDR